MKMHFEYMTELAFSSPAHGHRFTLKILPPNDERQRVEKLHWDIDPAPQEIWRSRDSFGNEFLCGYINEAHSHFRYGIHGSAMLSREPYTAYSENPIMRYHTKLTQPCEKIFDFYKMLADVASPDVSERVRYFSQAVHNHMAYTPGSTTPRTTASEAFAQNAGVCQDFAHILLALLRLDKIECRYVAGLASDYGETHAWVEAAIGGKHIGIDPTRNKLIDENYLTISRGRDFEDCSIERGVFKGLCRGTQNIQLKTC